MCLGLMVNRRGERDGELIGLSDSFAGSRKCFVGSIKKGVNARQTLSEEIGQGSSVGMTRQDSLLVGGGGKNQKKGTVSYSPQKEGNWALVGPGK